MPDVFRLAYVDLGTPSLEGATAYYRDVIGATVVENGASDAYLSLGLDQHNIALHASPRPGLCKIGLQVGSNVRLEDLAARLRGSGLTVEAKTDSRPGVKSLLDVEVGGHCFQLFQSMDMPAPGFSHTGVVPNRIGHMAVITPDARKLLQFQTNELGFWTTNWFEEQVTFVTCNRDHQVDAVDKLTRNGRPVVWGPSRHTTGHNLASHHYGADGLLVEFYTDMDVFLPDLDSFEPRLWHGDLPQKPKHWPITEMTRWQTGFEFDMAAVAWGVS